ncbi:hypothetical protein EH223_18885 [candidate division KSB1 bacterium]|nr:hypothetical protein [candidate division KSB1 bacterium]RQW00369.1 MAG: hypothetical protein EH223_18885 [candidate division KSB1 bacterium]
MFAKKVWIYSGRTISEIYPELFKVSSVLVIHEHPDHFDASFLFYFHDQWITLHDRIAQKRARHFSGYTMDSRGLPVEWSLNVRGETITGFYHMDYDRGRVEFKLISLQQSVPAQRQRSAVAT